jgi:hypothetical protein
MKWKLKDKGLTEIQEKKLRHELLGLSLDCSTGKWTSQKEQRKTKLYKLLANVWVLEKY